jgi:hypothetical protein
MHSNPKGAIVYIVYLGDVGSTSDQPAGDIERRFQVACAVIVKHELFTELEEFFAAMGEYLPGESLDPSKEFQTSDMLKAEVVSSYGIPVVYSAVDKQRLLEQVFSTADPLDMALRRCAEGIEKWFTERAPGELGLLIADEGNKWKDAVHTVFRQPRRQSDLHAGRERSHLSEDIYFADSGSSKCIQLANICGRAIFNHLAGALEAEEVYACIKNQIYFSKLEP